MEEIKWKKFAKKNKSATHLEKKSEKKRDDEDAKSTNEENNQCPLRSSRYHQPTIGGYVFRLKNFATQNRTNNQKKKIKYEHPMIEVKENK